VVPFVFAYHPALLMQGSAVEITLAAATAAIGVAFLGVGCAGYLFSPLGWGKRAWASLGGLLLSPSPTSGLWRAATLVGLALGLLLALVEWAGAPRRIPELAAESSSPASSTAGQVPRPG
jgi:TRAP-type uncharacterized transport system fused permease subunit